MRQPFLSSKPQTHKRVFVFVRLRRRLEFVVSNFGRQRRSAAFSFSLRLSVKVLVGRVHVLCGHGVGKGHRRRQARHAVFVEFAVFSFLVIVAIARSPIVLFCFALDSKDCCWSTDCAKEEEQNKKAPKVATRSITASAAMSSRMDDELLRRSPRLLLSVKYGKSSSTSLLCFARESVKD